MEEIKVCPFCGKMPSLNHEIHVNKDNRGMEPHHEIEIGWEVRCMNCGTMKKSFGRTFYKMGEDGQFRIVPQSFEENEEKSPSDKRLEVIAKWNERH